VVFRACLVFPHQAGPFVGQPTLYHVPAKECDSAGEEVPGSLVTCGTGCHIPYAMIRVISTGMSGYRQVWSRVSGVWLGWPWGFRFSRPRTAYKIRNSIPVFVAVRSLCPRAGLRKRGGVSRVFLPFSASPGGIGFSEFSEFSDLSEPPAVRSPASPGGIGSLLL
jgi:hypothetical protein